MSRPWHDLGAQVWVHAYTLCMAAGLLTGLLLAQHGVIR